MGLAQQVNRSWLVRVKQHQTMQAGSLATCEQPNKTQVLNAMTLHRINIYHYYTLKNVTLKIH